MEDGSAASAEEKEAFKNLPMPNFAALPHKALTFDFEGEPMKVDVPVDAQLDAQLRAAPHLYQYTGQLPKDWRKDYYKMFIANPVDEAAGAYMLDQLRALRPGITRDSLAELVIAFVQGGISYDWQTYHNIDDSNIRYPYETVFDGTGVCADKSILLAQLLQQLGYGLAVFTFPKANHMALGIRVPRAYGNYNTEYAFVESTSYTAVGLVPDNYVGGTKLERNPRLIPLATKGNAVFEKIAENRQREKEWTRKYGKNFVFYSPQQRKLKIAMTDMEIRLGELKAKMRGCKGTLPPARFEECGRLQDEYNSIVSRYNKLAEEFNALNDKG